MDKFGSKKGLLRYCLDELYCRVGAFRDYTRCDTPPDRLVFVCQGNICRSALAEWVFKGHSDIEAISLGLNTNTGKGANPRLLKIAYETKNIDLSSHKTTSVEDYVPRTGDVFVCMEASHIREIKSLGYNGPFLLLGSFGKKKTFRINDPYSANDTFMTKTIDDIVYHTVELAKSLKR
ncbi:low molecular weight phosphatase family protein [Marinobacter salicampi]|uniref:arsenate-mycothiol transferase ArsC n=1 Tax=Marinobacter salicampi TaxID=435907 RepID=UPI00140C49E4|nr:low molecular weight phosphatase family protein [Marinobacter salicampi]